MKKYFYPIIFCSIGFLLKEKLFAQNISINTSGASNSTLSMLEVLQISTTANTKGFYVAHSGAISGTGYGIWSQVTGASTTNIAGYFTATGATNNYAGIFDQGFVGIGTTAPQQKLDVRGVAAINGGSLYAATNNYLTTGAIDIGDYGRNYGGGSGWNANTAGLFLECLDNTEIAVHDAGTRIASMMYFEGAGTNRITIGRDMGWGAIGTVYLNGNVGIGINPSVKLDVNGDVLTRSYFHSAGYGIDTWIPYTDGNTYFRIPSAGYIYFDALPGYGNIMTIKNNGNVGIGTSSPNYKLELVGTSGTTLRIADGNQANGKVMTSDATGVASWQTPAGGGGGDWLITGNAGTVDGTNFLGTTDNVPLNFRVFNQKAGRIESVNANTFLGYQAENSYSNAGSNTAIGYQALQANASGGGNVAIGVQALNNNAGNTLGTLGFGNIAIGNNSMNWNVTGNSNTAVGFQSLFGNSGTNPSYNTAVGYLAMYADQGSNHNTAIGYYTLGGSGGFGSTGQYNTAAGSEALEFAGGNSYNTAIGGLAMWSANNGGSDNTAIGYNVMQTLSSGATRNVAVGSQAMASTTTKGNDNVALGYQAAYGAGLGGPTLSGSRNISIGSNASVAQRDESDNLAIGYQALKTTSYNNSGTGVSFYNVAIGNQAMYFLNPTSTSTGIQNTALGYQALYGTTGVTNNGSNNSAVGFQALKNNTTSGENVAIGYQALFTQAYTNSNTAWSSYNVAIGNQALYANQPTSTSNGYKNSALGYQALYNNTTGYGNSAFGYNALYSSGSTTGNNNTAVGNSAMSGSTGVTGNNNTAIGYSALNTNSSGASNTAVGYGALALNSANSNNTAIGYNAGSGNGCGGANSNNTFIGYQAGLSVKTGSNNTALGYGALQSFYGLFCSSGLTGNNNTAIGYNAVGPNITSGANNTAVGYTALQTVSTGSNNTAIGYGADISSGALTNATAIGNGASVTASNNMVFGNGSVVGWGFGVAPGGNAITVGNSASNGNGANLTLAGAWTNGSDSTKKRDIKNISYGLNEVMKLRPVNYKWKITGQEDFGFLAQEVKHVLPEIVYGKEGQMTISYGQITSVLTKAIQEQQAMIEKLQLEKASLQFQLDKQNSRIDKLEFLLNVAKK